MDPPDFGKKKYKRALLAIPEDSIDINDKSENPPTDDLSSQQPFQPQLQQQSIANGDPVIFPPTDQNDLAAENNFFSQFTQEELQKYNTEVEPIKKKYLLSRINEIESYITKKYKIETSLQYLLKYGPYLSYTSLYILFVSSLNEIQNLFNKFRAQYDTQKAQVLFDPLKNNDNPDPYAVDSVTSYIK